MNEWDEWLIGGKTQEGVRFTSSYNEKNGQEMIPGQEYGKWVWL